MSPYGGVQTIIDSLDLDPDNPDMDNDSLTDGLETGNIVTIPGIGLDIAGTDINATFTWVINGLNVEVHNFTADEDPSTTTDPNKADTDGDGIPDGVEDCDMPALASSQTLKSTDLNGKFDGMGLNETNPLDRDTDDDGLVDGTEDADHDGLWDWNPSTFAGETCSWELDSDGDGLGDGLETGKNYSTIISDTNAFIFVPDSNSSTTTNPLKIDTDSDGVPDGWIDGWNMTSSGELGIFNVPDYECQFGEG
jgi:hypothetical protein